MYATKGLSELTEKLNGWQWCWKKHDDHDVNIEKMSRSKKKNKSSIFLEKNP